MNPDNPATRETEATIQDAPGIASDVERLAHGDTTKAELEALRADVDVLYSHVPGVIQETKAGYKTTEFWLTIGGAFLTQIGALHLPGKYGATIATVALVGSYALSRGVAKNGVPHSE